MFNIETKVLAFIAAGVFTLAILTGLVFWGRDIGIKHDAKRTAPIIKQLGDDLALCRTNEVTLRGAIDQRNDDIKDWKAKATAAEKEADRLTAEARKASAQYLSDARRIASAPVTGDHCEWAAEFHVKTLEAERR